MILSEKPHCVLASRTHRLKYLIIPNYNNQKEFLMDLGGTYTFTAFKTQFPIKILKDVNEI